MSIELDLTGVESWTGSGGQPIPVGWHLAKIIGVEEKPASTGSPQVIVEWEVCPGEPAAGATSREWLVILPQTYGKIKAFLDAVSWPLQEGTFRMPVAPLMGRRARIYVADDIYNGKASRKVMAHEKPQGDAALPAGTPDFLPADIRDSVAQNSAEAKPVEPVYHDADDLPF